MICTEDGWGWSNQISKRCNCRNELTSKSENVFEDTKKYFIKMKEYLNKIIVNKTLLNNLILDTAVKTLNFKDKEKKSDTNCL